ncbi:uncharacterized protein ACNS7B_021568 [Menidia menidia]
MSSNISTIFLQIKGVDFSDSGLYFCGVYKKRNTVLVCAIEVIVKEGHSNNGEKADGVEDLMSVILGALSVFLTVVVIVLAVRIRRLQTALHYGQSVTELEITASDLNYSALNFQAEANRRCRPALRRQPDPHVVYAATR